MTYRRRSRALLGILLAAGALAAVPPSAHAAPPAGGLDPGKAWKVTLLTGDVVGVRTVKGKPPLVSVTPAPGREKRSFRKEIRPDGHVVVTPVDVAALVGKVIDPELFDVTALITQGYDDARSKTLPLIVKRDEGTRALPALGKMKDLPSIGAVAVRQAKGDAGALGRTLAGMRGPSAKATGGIRHIWLDGKVKASFAPTAPGPRGSTGTCGRSGPRRRGGPATPARARRSPFSTRVWTRGIPISRDASPSPRTSPSRPTPSTGSGTARTSPRPSPVRVPRRTGSARASPRTRTFSSARSSATTATAPTPA